MKARTPKLKIKVGPSYKVNPDSVDVLTGRNRQGLLSATGTEGGRICVTFLLKKEHEYLAQRTGAGAGG